MDVGRSLRVAMAKNNTTNTDIINAFGVTAATVCVWKKGKTQRGEVITKLAQYFDMSASEFIRIGEE